MANSIRNWWNDLRGHSRMRTAAWRRLHGREFEAAASLIDQGRQRFPGSLSFEILHARYLLLSDQRDRAAAILDHDNGLEPSDGFDQFELAESFRMLDRPSEAIGLYEQLVNSGPLNLPLLASQRLSSIYHRLEQPENALRASVDCVRLGGGQRQFSTLQVAATCEPAIVRAALQEIQNIQPRSPNHEIHRLKFVAHLSATLKQWELAIDAIAEATKRRFLLGHNRELWDDSQPPLRPAVIVIGAMKSGTTVLFRQLQSHPNMVAPLDKELQFFNQPDWPDEFYFAQFPRVASRSPALLTGEASPGYYNFDIVDRVKRMLPDVKIVFIRRDPVDRAISHLFHNQRQYIREHRVDVLTNGMDRVLELCSLDEKSFRIRLRDVQNERLAVNRYLLMGCYDTLIRGWKMAFPPEQFLDLQFADYVSSTQQTMSRVFEFVGLAPHRIDESLSSNMGRYKGDSVELRELRIQLEKFYERVAQRS